MSNLKRFLPLITAVLILCSTAQARVGESRSSLESRLLKDRTAVKVPSRLQEKLLNDRSVPYRALYEYFPESAEQEVYYKLSEDGQATTADLETTFPDGWMVHVVYLNGQSVFEAYRRNGAGITRYEEEGILMVNMGGSHWQRVNPKDVQNTAIGCSLERTDGEVRAIRKGNFLIVYRTEFDEAVKKLQDEANAESDAEAQENAPDSLRGF
jgi:hypothetical protein